MSDAPRTDAELLAELGPLAAAIGDKVHTVPVRLGPGGADQLISEITLAVAVYVGRHVLPREALELRQPPKPTIRQWQVETRSGDGPWRAYGAPWPDHTAAREDFEEAVRTASTRRHTPRREFRLIRTTASYAVEAQHTPEHTS
ncbi:hypothetical protein AB0P07_11980 [Streptomyces sp. NPDC085944]|uniref:hypothetical protein n=1 Tax=Streptomyces sp. NPDC085944 TaxID=3154962 RepID=UPI003430DC84